MLRIVATADGVAFDAERGLAGRGGYLHPRPACLERFLGSRIKEFRSSKRKINRNERLVLIDSIRMRLDSGTSVA